MEALADPASAGSLSREERLTYIQAVYVLLRIKKTGGRCNPPPASRLTLWLMPTGLNCSVHVANTARQPDRRVGHVEGTDRAGVDGADVTDLTEQVDCSIVCAAINGLVIKGDIENIGLRNNALEIAAFYPQT